MGAVRKAVDSNSGMKYRMVDNRTGSDCGKEKCPERAVLGSATPTWTKTEAGFSYA